MREPEIRPIPAAFEQLAAKLAGAPVPRRKVVSLFSGCGGMDLGFVGGFQFGTRYYDRLPFEIVWANDLNARACDTYQSNLRHDIERGPLSDAMGTLPKRADVVIGGFPCQDVSINGSRLVEEGGRTILYREMIEVVHRVRPAAFVAENVKGLTMAHGKAFFERMLADFAALPGYALDHRVYLAADTASRKRGSASSSWASRARPSSFRRRRQWSTRRRRTPWPTWRRSRRTGRPRMYGARRGQARIRDPGA